ncbi:MAG: alpha/beta hydrolase [Tenericutes bacterium]|nr:alpha/beta hydrolase [Mycoplasmatota bacterium]
MPYIIITIVVLILIGFIVGTVFTFGLIKPKKRNFIETAEIESEYYPGIMEFYKENLTTKYIVKSKYGYDLQAYFLKNKIESKKFMVMAHGHTYTHHGCLKYARMMMKHGYNIVLYDERFHGDSGGEFTCLGYLEKDDLYTMISDTISRYGDDIFIGTYGESMGAATVLLEAEIDKRIKFVVSDCSFSDFSLLIRQLSWSKFKIPVYPIYWFTLLVFKINTGINIKGISPIKAINNVSVPIMFVHGKADAYIPYTHSVDMYESYKGEKQLFLADNNAQHAGSYYADQEKYEWSIKEFLDKYVK